MRGWLVAPTTPPAYAWPARTTGPSVRSMARVTTFTSSSSVVSGMGAAVTLIPACCRPVMTRPQLEPSAHAPWTRTTVGVVGLMGAFRFRAVRPQRPISMGDADCQLGCTAQNTRHYAVQRSTCLADRRANCVAGVAVAVTKWVLQPIIRMGALDSERRIGHVTFRRLVAGYGRSHQKRYPGVRPARG